MCGRWGRGGAHRAEYTVLRAEYTVLYAEYTVPGFGLGVLCLYSTHRAEYIVLQRVIDALRMYSNVLRIFTHDGQVRCTVWYLLMYFACTLHCRGVQRTLLYSMCTLQVLCQHSHKAWVFITHYRSL